MSVRFARTTADKLTYHVYGRFLHPELFDTCKVRELRQGPSRMVLRICESGHVVEFCHPQGVVSEISTTSLLELPRRGQCLSIPLKGGRDISARPAPGVDFKASTQIEWLDPQVFERLTEEFRGDLNKATLSQEFTSRNRWRPEPLSLLHAESGPGCLVVHAYHTFPDEFAIVRTQSLYEF